MAFGRKATPPPPPPKPTFVEAFKDELPRAFAASSATIAVGVITNLITSGIQSVSKNKNNG